MSFIERIGLRRPAAVHRLSRIVQSWVANRPLPTPHDFATFSEEGYRQNVIIYSCVKEIARSVAEPELRIMREGADGPEPIPAEENHPLMRLFGQPNEDQGQFEWLEELVTHLQVAGNAYVHKERTAGTGLPVELYCLRPDRMKIVPASDGTVLRYEFGVSDAQKVQLPAVDVIHTKLVDTGDDFYGLSPVSVLARYGDIDKNAADYLRSYFMNGAPLGIMKFKMAVDPAERQRIKDLWRTEHVGEGAWHNLAVIDADADYQTIGSTLDRLRLDAVFDETESRICSTFGVPPILIGTRLGLMRSTYANYIEAKRQFWEQTLAPLYTRLGDVLTIGLCAEYDEEAWIEFDLSDVSALQESIETRRRWALDGFGSGLLSRSEARAVVGLDPVEGDEAGEVYRVPQGSSFVYADGEPLQPPIAKSPFGVSPFSPSALQSRQKQKRPAKS